MANPSLGEVKRADLVGRLMGSPGGRYATPGKRVDLEAEAMAHRAVDELKQALGERRPVQWSDGSPDLNRHMAKNTLYANWYAKLARSDHGGV